MIKDKSIQAFLDELAGKAATPGGGSAAAVMGAMGAALVSMVANFTVGKKGYEAVDAEAAELLRRAESLRRQLTEMIRADVEAFDGVMAAYGLARDTDAQKAARTGAIQAALKKAADIPLACAALCAEVIGLTRPMAAIGNKNVISDAGVAVLAAEAALRSAALNVYVNVGAIKDEAFVADRRQRLEQILAGSEALTEEVYALVKGRL
ncbi:MAG: cyclodeaminase/cyclohydrolase family protein [Gammaproteobacteria bacterium]|nr:cyclodeaminase/cyclohydrolase family protein [Gammaproteobacteria bacterium]